MPGTACFTLVLWGPLEMGFVVIIINRNSCDLHLHIRQNFVFSIIRYTKFWHHPHLMEKYQTHDLLPLSNLFSIFFSFTGKVSLCSWTCLNWNPNHSEYLSRHFFKSLFISLNIFWTLVSRKPFYTPNFKVQKDFGLVRFPRI